MTAPVTPQQRDALRALVPALPDDAYLAGGVAVAAALGHRLSRDLDFFVPEDFDPQSMAERLVAQVSGLIITSTAAGTLYVEVNGVPASILVYRYPLLAEPQPSAELGVRVASLEDLACMKLSAIASRGLARDFWDLHGLLQRGVADGSLEKALTLYREKYASHDIGHVVRSLVYFGEADQSPLPRGLSAPAWAAMKRDLEGWVAALQ